MSFSQSEIDGLRATIAKGVLRFRYEDGREVQYQSLSEMRQLLREMEGDIASSTGVRKKRGHSIAGF